MSSPGSPKQITGKASGPIAHKRKAPQPLELDSTEKSVRTRKRRKVVRQHAKQLRKSDTPIPSLPGEVHLFFTKLPIELQKEVLSHLPLKDLCLARRSCKKLCGIIDAFENDLARPTIAYHINRLQAKINEINAVKLPTDVDSFLACLRIWTSTRGSFRNPDLSQESYDKWFSHLAGGKPRAKEGEPEEEFQQWAKLAVLSTQIQCQMNHYAANNMLRHEAQDVDGLWHVIRDNISKFDCPLNATEIRKLYERIRDAQGDERDISGPWHRPKKERATFPSDKTEKMTHADHYRAKLGRPPCSVDKTETAPVNSSSRYRLTPIRSEDMDTNEKYHELRHPVRPAEIMCGNLGLPTLPEHHTFCYYVTKAWVFDKLRKSHPGPYTMKPLMRAAALESVEIF